MFSEMFKFFIENDLISSNQSGVKPGDSCVFQKENPFKKIPCYMRELACRWLIVENPKIFQSHVKHFLIFPRERNCRILIGL